MIHTQESFRESFNCNLCSVEQLGMMGIQM